MTNQRESTRNTLRKFWLSPLGQHNDPSFIVTWKRFLNKDTKGCDDLTRIFTSFELPVILTSAIDRIDNEMIDSCLREMDKRSRTLAEELTEEDANEGIY